MGDNSWWITKQWRRLRSWVYDIIIVAMTSAWYRAVMTDLPMDAVVLDVGIGTGNALLANRDLLVTKNLRFVGVDYDADYIATARAAVATHRGCGERVELHCASIFDFTPATKVDAVYFSGSFMILPDKVKALRMCAEQLKDRATGAVYFTQTLEKKGTAIGFVLGKVKPLLKHLLTIDFGEVTHQEDLLAAVGAAGLEVHQLTVLKKGATRDQVMLKAGWPGSAPGSPGRVRGG